MSSPPAEQSALYALQDHVLALCRSLETGFYLTGGLAAARGYVQHRLCNEIALCCNHSPHFPLWTEQISQRLSVESIWKFQVGGNEERRRVLGIAQGRRSLMITLVNDGPLHIGKISDHPQLGRLDSVENILAGVALAMMSRTEPGDLADLLVLCVRYNLSLANIITRPDSKAAGIFAPDLARLLYMASKEDWEAVRWLQKPPLEVFLAHLRRHADKLLHVTQSGGASAQAAQAAALQAAANKAAPAETDRPAPPKAPPPPPPQPSAEKDAAPASLPPIHGTGILNYYKAMKASGIQALGDSETPAYPPEQDPYGPGTRPAQPAAAPPKPAAPSAWIPEKPITPAVQKPPIEPKAPAPSERKPVAKSTSELRASARKKVEYYVPIHDNISGATIGYLTDISATGLQMDCKKYIIPGQVLALRMTIPPEMSRKAILNFTAECRWCRPDNLDPGLYDAGFEVHEISAEDSKLFLLVKDKFGTG